MEYPKNGSIVIIDDKYEEVEGLIRVFSSKGIPVTYFNGEPDKLITLNGTRIVFLDLDLKLGARDSEEKDIISTVFANLKKVVPQNNGGYILVLWSTRDSEFGENVETEIKKMQARETPIIYEYPLEIVRISKHDVSTREEGKLNFDLNKIEEQINELVPENSILNLVTYWENKVSEASKNVISHFDGITHTENKQKLLLALFADSSTPEGSLDQNTIIAPAISPMSVLLSDQLSSKISSHNLSVIGKELTNILASNEKIDLESVAAINTFYHVDMQMVCNDAPGVVYDYREYMKNYSCSSKECSTRWAENLLEKVFSKLEIPSKKFDKSFKDTLNEKNIHEIEEHINSQYTEGDTLVRLNRLTYEDSDISEDIYVNVHKDKDKKKILKKLFIEIKQKIFFEDLISESIPIFLEFSPDCDYVQNKRKKLRLIFGVLIPYNFQNILQEEKKLTLLNIVGDNIINTPILQYKDKNYQMVFDLHTITGINKNAFDNIQPIFRLRKELIVDIQQKIASHIARPGFFNMNDYLEK